MKNENEEKHVLQHTSNNRETVIKWSLHEKRKLQGSTQGKQLNDLMTPCQDSNNCCTFCTHEGYGI